MLCHERSHTHSGKTPATRRLCLVTTRWIISTHLFVIHGQKPLSPNYAVRLNFNLILCRALPSLAITGPLVRNLQFLTLAILPNLISEQDALGSAPRPIHPLSQNYALCLYRADLGDRGFQTLSPLDKPLEGVTQGYDRLKFPLLPRLVAQV